MVFVFCTQRWTDVSKNIHPYIARLSVQLCPLLVRKVDNSAVGIQCKASLWQY